jgi:GNAT superfamily N-acetyltransferase
VLIRAASVDEVLPLRALVLRDGGALDTARFPEDDVAVHVVVLDPEVIACASTFRAPRPGESLAWRIRGVAVHPDWRGRGLGEAVVRTAMELAEAKSFWCTARLAAVGFWAHLGFTAEEETPFELPHGGLHHTMSLRLPRT